MANQPNRRCLITGASSGIGAALARRYAAAGWDLVITARRGDRLDALKDEIEGRYAGTRTVQVVTADLADPQAPDMLLYAALEDGPIDGLVNNAGFSPGGAMLDKTWEEHQKMLQVMLTAPTKLATVLAPKMKEAGFGRILNVSSVLGLVPTPADGSLYGPVKTYVSRFSEALQQNVRGSGVHVTALCPGFTETEIFEAAGNPDFMRSVPSWLHESLDDVADKGFQGCEKNKTVVTCSIVYKGWTGLLSVLPDALGRAMMRMNVSR